MQRPTIPPEFDAEKIIHLAEPQLIAILKDPASTTFQKAVACKMLAQKGTGAAVPVLAALLPSEEFSHYARFGLEPIPDASVDEALRAALPKLKGRLQVGVINSIGTRRDGKAIDALTKLMLASDVESARAAGEALGKIGGLAAAKALQDGLGRTEGEVRVSVAEGALLCAEQLLSVDRKAALALFDVLSRSDIPRPVRLAAMHSQILAETSLDRPR